MRLDFGFVTVLLNHGEDVASFISDRLAVEPDGAWVEAFGTVESVTIQVMKDGVRGSLELLGTWDLVRLTASLGHSEYGSAVLTSAGEVVGGLLTKAIALSVCVRVSTMPSSEQTSRTAAVASAPPVAQAPTAGTAAEAAPRAATEQSVPQELAALRPPSASDPGRVEQKATHQGGIALPPKPARNDGWMEEVYPDEGDRVNHFAFGDCTVVGGDGERIRLQQDRDSRVREVALSMLKIAPPTIGADGKKHWTLARKN